MLHSGRQAGLVGVLFSDVHFLLEEDTASCLDTYSHNQTTRIMAPEALGIKAFLKDQKEVS